MNEFDKLGTQVKLDVGEKIALPFDYDKVTNPVYFIWGEKGLYRIIGNSETRLDVKGIIKNVVVTGCFKKGNACIVVTYQDGSKVVSNDSGFTFHNCTTCDKDL
jgi:hypothetical protein